MKVKELIELLRPLDPEAEVFHLNYDSENGDDLQPVDPQVRTVVHEEWRSKGRDDDPTTILSVDKPCECPWATIERKIVAETRAVVISAGKSP